MCPYQLLDENNGSVAHIITICGCEKHINDRGGCKFYPLRHRCWQKLFKWYDELYSVISEDVIVSLADLREVLEDEGFK